MYAFESSFTLKLRKMKIARRTPAMPSIVRCQYREGMKQSKVGSKYKINEYPVSIKAWSFAMKPPKHFITEP